MTDVSLNDLVKQLRDLQQADVIMKLNDRNVVDILRLLRTRNITDIVYTTSGKEYLTRNQVLREVQDEIELSGGRINIIDLPNLIQVDFLTVERAVVELREQDTRIRVIDGEIITPSYVSFIVRDAASWLKENGCLSVSEFAKKHQLSSAFTIQILTDHISSGALSAVFNEDVIHTKTFVASQCRKMLCSLLGATIPTTIGDVSKAHYIRGASNFSDQLKGPLSAMGKLDSGTYTPHVFENTCLSRLRSALMSNGYVTYNQIREWGITKAYLVSAFNPPSINDTRCSKKGKCKGKEKTRGGIANSKSYDLTIATKDYPLAGHTLSSCFLLDRHFEVLEPLVEELISGETVSVDIFAHLPSVLDESIDGEPVIQCVMTHFPKLEEICQVYGNRYLFLKSAANGIIEDMRADFRKNNQSPTTQYIVDTLAHKLGAHTLRSNEAMNDIIFKTFSNHITEFLKEMDNFASMKGVQMKRKRQQEIYDVCAKAWEMVWQLNKGCSWIAANIKVESDVHAIHKGILTNEGHAILGCLLLDEAANNSVLNAWGSKVDMLNVNPASLTPAQVKAGVAAMGNKSVFKQLADIVYGGKDINTLVTSLQDYCSNGEVSMSCFHTPSKKTDREAFSAAGANIIHKLEEASFTNCDSNNIGDLFSLMVSCTLWNKSRCIMKFPGKCLSSAISALEDDNLTSGMKIVVKCLTSKERPTQADVEVLETYTSGC
eukprot:Tbor_TRINITY_DN5963_c0_g3::TRINITY_DN5963_c0_g3_i2::g.19296::m.19296